MKQKILVLTSTFPRWENDTEPPFVYELCKQLCKNFEVFVLAPHFKGAKKLELMHGMYIIRFPYFFSGYENLCYQGGMLANLKVNYLRYFLIPFYLFFQLIYAVIFIKKENISFIHAHWIIPQGLTAYILRLIFNEKIKILCTSHGGDFYSLRGKMAGWIKKSVLQRMDAITVVNSAMVKEVACLCATRLPKVGVIPMGIDSEKFFPIIDKQRPFSLLFVGRLVEKKGLHYLIEALPEIISQYPDISLTIIGTGPIKDDLETLVLEKKLDHHVNFLGSIPNNELPCHYQQHQIAIFPFIIADNGDREGLPVVVSEAIACGCCVITTDLPGIEDIANLTNGVITIPQKNSSAICDAVLRLYSNPDNIKLLANKAITSIKEKQSWQVIGNQYKTLITSLMPKETI